MTQEHPEQPEGELIDELRELVGEWREQVERAKSAGTRHGHWKAIEHKADELQEVIDRYE
jgi:hypothetical protein